MNASNLSGVEPRLGRRDADPVVFRKGNPFGQVQRHIRVLVRHDAVSPTPSLAPDDCSERSPGSIRRRTCRKVGPVPARQRS